MTDAARCTCATFDEHQQPCPFPITDHLGPGCEVCSGGLICEDHPAQPWDHSANCGCGMPCPACVGRSRAALSLAE